MIVTGGGQGLGTAIVEALAGAGGNVVVCSRALGESEWVAGEVSRCPKAGTLALRVDAGP